MSTIRNSKRFEFLAVGDWSPGELKVVSEYSADHLLFNLEGPILPSSKESLQPISKVGPHLSSTTLPKNAEIIIASLANNHIMDFGVSGARLSQEKVEKESGITAGFGNNLKQSREPKIFHYNKKAVALLSVAEDQFGKATLDQGGYATVGPWLYAEVKGLRPIVDSIIVTIHGGLEMSHFPSPYRVEMCRTLARLGANFVLCHHPHVPQGWEVYENSFIAYGLGNYCTDPGSIKHDGAGAFSLGIELDLSRPSESKVHLLRQTLQKTNEILLQSALDSDGPTDQLREKLCEPLKDENLLISLWSASLLPYYDRYYMQSVESSRTFSQKIVSMLFKVKHRLEGNSAKIQKLNLMKLKHFYSTESHRELIADSLTKKSGIQSSAFASTILDVDRHIEKIWEEIQEGRHFDNR